MFCYFGCNVKVLSSSLALTSHLPHPRRRTELNGILHDIFYDSTYSSRGQQQVCFFEGFGVYQLSSNPNLKIINPHSTTNARARLWPPKRQVDRRPEITFSEKQNIPQLSSNHVVFGGKRPATEDNFESFVSVHNPIESSAEVSSPSAFLFFVPQQSQI